MDHPSLLDSELFGELSESLQKEVAELVQWSGGFDIWTICLDLQKPRGFLNGLCSAHLETTEENRQQLQGEGSMHRIGQMLDAVWSSSFLSVD